MFPDAVMLDAIGQTFWRASWQASVLAVVVLAAVVLLRGRLSPAWRYGLWSLVLVRLLLPLAPQARWSAYTLVEAWERPVASGSSNPDELALPLASTGERADPSPVEAAGPAPLAAPGRPPLAVAPAPAPPPTILFSRVAASVWLAGVVAMAVGLGCRVRRLQRAANAWPEVADRRVLDVMTDCQRRLGLCRRVRLCVAPDDAGPAVLGLWRPRIVLPEAIMSGFGRDRLEAILLHELAHVRRRDVVVHWLMIAARVLHWFNPIAWLALSRMAADRELACDDVVIDVLGPSSRRLYGETMLRLLERLLVRPAGPGVVHFFGSRRRLRARLESLTRPRELDRGPKLIPIALLLGLAVFGLPDSVRSKATARGVAAIDKPRGRDQAQGKTGDLEDRLYKVLEKGHEFNNPRWPFAIKTRDVRGRMLVDATFRHRTKEENVYDCIIRAREAVLRIDPGATVLRVHMEGVEIQHFRANKDVILISDRILEIPLPPDPGIDVGR